MACKKSGFDTFGFLALGLMKGIVYAQSPKTIPDLKQAISDAISDIPNQMVKNATKCVTKRAQKIFEVLGLHYLCKLLCQYCNRSAYYCNCELICISSTVIHRHLPFKLAQP